MKMMRSTACQSVFSGEDTLRLILRFLYPNHSAARVNRTWAHVHRLLDPLKRFMKDSMRSGELSWVMRTLPISKHVNAHLGFWDNVDRFMNGHGLPRYFSSRDGRMLLHYLVAHGWDVSAITLADAKREPIRVFIPPLAVSALNFPHLTALSTVISVVHRNVPTEVGVLDYQMYASNMPEPLALLYSRMTKMSVTGTRKGALYCYRGTNAYPVRTNMLYVVNSLERLLEVWVHLSLVIGLKTVTSQIRAMHKHPGAIERIPIHLQRKAARQLRLLAKQEDLTWTHEVQEPDVARVELADSLCGRYANVCVAGSLVDDDQFINVIMSCKETMVLQGAEWQRGSGFREEIPPKLPQPPTKRRP